MGKDAKAKPAKGGEKSGGAKGEEFLFDEIKNVKNTLKVVRFSREGFLDLPPPFIKMYMMWSKYDLWPQRPAPQLVLATALGPLV